MNTFSSSVLTTMLLQTVAWPMLVVVTGMAIGQFVWRRHVSQQHMPMVSALAIGAGVLTAYALIYGQFTFPPLQALDWLPLLLLAGLIVFAVDDIVGFAPWLRLGMQGISALLAGGLLLRPILSQLPLMGAVLTLAGVTVLWFGLWVYLDRRALQDATSGVTLLTVAVGAAAVPAMTGSVLLGQLGGALAVVLAGWLLWNWPRPRWLLGHAGTAVTVLTLGSLLLVGRFYSETPLSISLLLLVALAANVPMALMKRYRPGLDAPLAVVLTGLLALVPVALAIGFTLLFYMSQAGEYGRY